MPDSTPLINGRFERAVADLEKDLFQSLTARRLDASEINSLYKNRDFAAGWQIDYSSSRGEKKLNLLLPGNFPFDPPAVGLAFAPEPLMFPHVENDGILCLLSNASTVSPYRPAEVTRSMLIDACNLLEDCFSGKNTEDFRLEFVSYWNRALTSDSFKFVSLVRPALPSRILTLWRGNNRYVLGEDEESVSFWLENRFGKKNYKFERAGLIWLPKSLLPAEYPKSNADILRIGNNIADKEAREVIHNLAAKAPDQISFLIGSRSELGPCLAGVTIQKPKKSASPHIKTKNPLERGFRSGQVPPSILAGRYFLTPNPAARYEVERADAAWIHGRYESIDQIGLSQKTVVLLGCGSLGSPLAKLLAMSGIGKLILIDPENLTWANTGRHFLGAKYVGYSKSQNTAQEIKENYPHLVVEFKAENWETVARKEPELFTSADLIVSAIGDWASEAALNEWQQTADLPPVVYGWMEPFAAAGHAMAIFKNGACLQCQINEVGEPTFRVTRWEQKTIKQEPACGVMYQPYGPIEANNSINLMAETIVDVLTNKISVSTERIWACRKLLLEASGGEWTEDWLALNRNNSEGGFSISRRLYETEVCPICALRGKCRC